MKRCKREADAAVRSWETCKGLQQRRQKETEKRKGKQKSDKADTVTNKKNDKTGDKGEQKGDKADTMTNQKRDKKGERRDTRGTQ